MTVSIIIPTYNEEGHIRKLLTYLTGIIKSPLIEIIVADGGSNDKTMEEVISSGVTFLLSPKKGRAAQMNYAASNAKGGILYFLHADSYPPVNFINEITASVNSGYSTGCFRLAFDYQHWFLRLNCWFTRFDSNLIRFGDQSLFVTKEVFFKAGGFKEELIVMEDLEIIPRIRRHARFKVQQSSVTTSARKYRDNGIYKLQTVFFIIYLMYKCGYSQEKLIKTYRTLISQKKI